MQAVAPIRVPELAARVMQLLAMGSFQAFLVGGAVRDLLLGRTVVDLDIATDARPDEVIKLAEKAGIRTLPTGIDHGTITLLMEQSPVEITSFRKDVATDGRRAVVSFSKEMGEDAQRRDFTINALYADHLGHVHDPVGLGIADLLAGRIRFIGVAEERVREDYLRGLRFFRFHAWFGKEPPYVEGVAAIRNHLDGLEKLARERIGAEMLKLLEAPSPLLALHSMGKNGVLEKILPGAELAALKRMEGLAHFLEGKLSLVRLAALQAGDPVAALRLSRKQASFIHSISAHRGMLPAEIGYRFQEDAPAALVLKTALEEGSISQDAWRALHEGQKAAFPLKASDLMPTFQGRRLGKALETAERQWIASGFQLGRAELIEAAYSTR